MAVHSLPRTRGDDPDKLFRHAERARRESRFGEALTLYRRARAAYERGTDHDGERDTLLGVGDCLRMLGRFAQAHRAYTHALRLSQLLADPEGQAESLA
ncbi:MAG: tetratricopeptide repeat protein, partial [Thermodesulfobacteriota bacterium]